MPSKNRVTINLSKVEYSELRSLARLHGVSMAWVCRQAVAQMLHSTDRKPQLPLDLPLQFDVSRKDER